MNDRLIGILKTALASRTTLWKKVSLTFVLCVISLSGLFSQGASDTQDMTPWNFLAETETFVDISERVIRCGDVYQLHLTVFNESPNAQSIRFRLDISEGNKSFSKDFDLNLEIGGLYQAACGTEDYLEPYRIAIPKDYDPANISVAITILK